MAPYVNKFIILLCMTLFSLPISAMELSNQVMAWQTAPNTSKYETLSDMDMLTDNEMDTVTGQHMVSVMLEAEDGSNSFEINVEFTTSSFGGIIEFTKGETIIDDKKYGRGFIVFMGPTGDKNDMLAQLTATVPSGAVMEMEVNTTDHKGLDIGGTRAFEIPPFTTFARVSIPDIEYDIYVAEDMKIILDSTNGDKELSPNAKTLGILRLFDLDFDLSFPKESSIYIYPS